MNKPNDTSTNVLAICNMNILFIYTYIGILGSAHDAKVLVLAMKGPHQFPTAEYYLGDSGHPLQLDFLLCIEGKDISLDNTIKLVRPVVLKKCLTK